ncbi:MAG: hypothetical protein ABJE95_14160 [Byssovorax sp.]
MSAPEPAVPIDEEKGAPLASPSPARGGIPILRLVPPFAALALVASLLGRAIGPSMEGLAVGLGRLIETVKLSGGVLSQVLAVAAIVLAMGEILVVSRSRVPAPVRLGSIGLGGAVVLVCFLASPRRESLPDALVLLMSLSAVAFALLAGVSALKASFSRAAGLILILVAADSLLRLIAVAIAAQARTAAGERLAVVAGVVSTAGFLAGVVAMAIAAAWIASRSKKLASAGTLLPLAAALFLTQRARAADGDDAGTLSVLVHRVVERLIARPLPLLPAGFQIFVALLAPLLAIAALASRPARGASAAALAPPSIAAAIALALLMRDAADLPLGALALVIAALTVAIAAHDERAVWDAIAPANRPSSDRPVR